MSKNAWILKTKLMLEYYLYSYNGHLSSASESELN